MVPNAVIEKVISECHVCLRGKHLPKVAVGKPIMAKDGCKDNECSCRRSGFLCATKCHPSATSCHNKSESESTLAKKAIHRQVENEVEEGKGCNCKTGCKKARTFLNEI